MSIEIELNFTEFRIQLENNSKTFWQSSTLGPIRVFDIEERIQYRHVPYQSDCVHWLRLEQDPLLCSTFD